MEIASLIVDFTIRVLFPSAAVVIHFILLLVIIDKLDNLLNTKKGT